jgi:cardiolipin synthase
MRIPGIPPRWANVLRKLRRYLGRGLLALLTGCRGAAAPYTPSPTSPTPPRAVLVACQLVEDSAVEVANRPVQSCWHFLNDMFHHLWAVAEGAVGKRILMPLQGPPPPLAPAAEPLDLTELEAELTALTGEQLDASQVHLHLSGEQALAALEDLIARAEKQIDVLMFYWDNDALGQALAQRLAARAGPDLRVRVLVDGGGNLFFAGPDSAWADRVNGALALLANHPYIEVVRIRNPFGRYDHRKLVIVDGRLAWTGGRNFSLEAFFEHHDLSFVIDGPLVQRLQRQLDEHWQEQNGSVPQEQVVARASAGVQSVSNRPAWEALRANTWARLLRSEPGRRELAPALYRAIDSARQHIYLENVYLCDSRLIYKLAQARRRGVDVRVVLTFNSTTGAIDRANRVLANRLLAAGVRVYIYPGMTHVKAMTVDGCWAYLGTGNFDALSLRHNYELGLAVTACPLVSQLEQQLFLPDFRPEWELTRPVSVTVADYLAEVVASFCL